MNKIYIKNKNDTRMYLMCEQDLTPLSEVPIESHQPRKKSFYVRYPGGYIGASASFSGPILFVNEKKYSFSDNSWSISVLEGEDTNTASFSNLDGESLIIKYEKTIQDILDPWSQKEFDDFFIWLSHKKEDTEFWEMWTEES